MIDVPVWMIWSAFGLSLTGALAIFGLSARSAWRSDFQFFPPPSKASWPHRTFLALFRLYLYPLIGLTLLVMFISAFLLPKARSIESEKVRDINQNDVLSSA